MTQSCSTTHAEKTSRIHLDARQCIANPAPLGLMAFGCTTFVLSCYHAGIFGMRGSSPTNAVVGMALSYGGIAQILAGMWEFRTGNTFGATAFTSYGAFLLSYAIILVPGSGVIDGYVLSGYSDHFDPALGIFLLSWTMFTLMMWLCTLRTNCSLTSLFFLLFITFLLLTIGRFMGSSGGHLHRAGGFLGIIVAFIAWYMALAHLLTKENSYFTLPLGKIGVTSANRSSRPQSRSTSPRQSPRGSEGGESGCCKL